VLDFDGFLISFSLVGLHEIVYARSMEVSAQAEKWGSCGGTLQPRLES